MRWDQSLKAAGAATLVVLIGMLPAVFADMKITSAELWLLASAVGGTFFSYIKDHPPQ